MSQKKPLSRSIKGRDKPKTKISSSSSKKKTKAKAPSKPSKSSKSSRPAKLQASVKNKVLKVKVVKTKRSQRTQSNKQPVKAEKQQTEPKVKSTSVLSNTGKVTFGKATVPHTVTGSRTYRKAIAMPPPMVNGPKSMPVSQAQSPAVVVDGGVLDQQSCGYCWPIELISTQVKLIDSESILHQVRNMHKDVFTMRNILMIDLARLSLHNRRNAAPPATTPIKQTQAQLNKLIINFNRLTHRFNKMTVLICAQTLANANRIPVEELIQCRVESALKVVDDISLRAKQMAQYLHQLLLDQVRK